MFSASRANGRIKMRRVVKAVAGLVVRDANFDLARVGMTRGVGGGEVKRINATVALD